VERAHRWPAARIATTAAIASAVVVFAVLVYARRWMSDVGLIVVRVAREILDGYGPNFNVFERAEPNTSALWQWFVAIGGLITRADLAYVAVLLGGVLAVAGFACALDASRRFHRARSGDGAIVPCGALIVLGVFPFWDFATAGLETGLAFFWISASFWLLVTLPPDASRRRQLGTAVALGLGPLVRPDLALVSGPMLGALWWLLRPRRRRTLVLAAAALAAPLAYTIFRAGYYGTLVPLPALAKSAGSAQWSRGLGFVGHYVVTYQLWVPLVALAGMLAVHLKRGTMTARDRVLIAVPIVCGLALVVYVARVGGDFMHGRILLVPTWLLVLPAMTVPLRRWTTPVLVVVAGWALVVAATTRHIEGATGNWNTDWDERVVYVGFTGHEHPIDPALFVDVPPVARVIACAHDPGLPPLLIWDGNGSMTLLDPEIDAEFVIVAGRLGTAAASVAVDAIVIDLLGLANPLGARITVTAPGHTGHEKFLPVAWILAEYGHPDVIASMPDEERARVAAARHALTCGDLAELLAAAREPMTASRFWTNLLGAWHRTGVVVPSDPVEAERRFCGSK
jgi:arabinofuranosyltransferase